MKFSAAIIFAIIGIIGAVLVRNRAKLGGALMIVSAIFVFEAAALGNPNKVPITGGVIFALIFVSSLLVFAGYLPYKRLIKAKYKV